MSEETKHTPTPWLSEKNGAHSGEITTVHWCGETEEENYRIEIWSPEATGASPMQRLANARLILTACNAHEEMVALLRDIETCEVIEDQVQRSNAFHLIALHANTILAKLEV